MISANDISKLNQKLKLIESAQQVNEVIPAAIAGGRALLPYAGRALQSLRPAARPGPTTKNMGRAVEVPKTSLPAPIRPTPSNSTAKSLAAGAAGGAAVAGGISALDRNDNTSTQPAASASAPAASLQGTGKASQLPSNAAASGLTAAETAEIHKLALELSKFKDSNEQVSRAYLDYLKKFPTQ